MLLGVPQPPLVGLAVDRDEVLADLTQDRDRSAAATDAGARPPLGRDGPHQDEPVRGVAPGLLHPPGGGVVVGHVDLPLDHGPGRPGPHQAGVGALPQEEPEPADHHRLAGPGLAGDDVETGSQVELRLLDDPELLEPDATQRHAVTPG